MMRRRTPLQPDVLAELERRGVASVAATLAHLARYDGAGVLPKPERQAAFVLRETDAGAVCVTRREVETWLAWKSAGELRWIKVGVSAAVLAAVLSAFSWLLPLR